MKHRTGKQPSATSVKNQRSQLMGRVRRSGTAPELALRRALRRAGIAYRLRDRGLLPGSPDLVFPIPRLAVFVDGCFWHGCAKHGSRPKTNVAFWEAKLLRNRLRDRRVDRALKRLGWAVVRVWEHDVRADVAAIVRVIGRRLDQRPKRAQLQNLPVALAGTASRHV